MNHEKKASSIDEFARDHSIGRDSVYEAIRSGKLIARKLGKKKTLILAEDGAAFMKALPVLQLPAEPVNPVTPKVKKQRVKAPAPTPKMAPGA